MINIFKLPELGEGIKEATVVDILVKVGDVIEDGQGVIEVESDKATAEVPIDGAGKVDEMYVKEGDTIRPGDQILSLDSAGADGGTPEPAPVKKAPARKEPSPQKKETRKIVAGDKRIEFRLPSLGEGFDQGDVVSILVRKGEAIEKDQSLLELESDKATSEIPCDHAGVIEKIHVKEGDTLTVGSLIITLLAESEGGAADVPEAPAKKAAFETGDDHAAGTTKTVDEETAAARLGTVMATPGVRRLARELGINIQAVSGSGTGGRITENDVKEFARQLIYTGDRGDGVISPLLGEKPPFDQFGPLSYEKMTGVRHATARQMAKSWNEVARVTHFAEADFTAMNDTRRRYREHHKINISVTAMLVKILSQAMEKFPRFNAMVEPEQRRITYRKYINVGIAVDTPRGLLVPVIRNVDRKNVRKINEEMANLADTAREGKLTPEHMRGGGMTISNIGGLGGSWFTPIVNPPEVAILGVGASSLRPVVDKEGTIVARPLCPLSLSYDHRPLDGADAARFMSWLVDAIENPLLAVLEGGQI